MIKRTQKRILQKVNNVQNQTSNARGCINNNLPTINVKLSDNLTVNSLLDSGSNVNCINKDMLNLLITNRLVKKLSSERNVCIAANNTKIKITGCCLVKIKINMFSWYVKFYITPELNWKMILGSCFIRESCMIINLSKNECMFKFKPNVKTSLCPVECTTMNHIVLEEEIDIGCLDMKVEVKELINKYPNVFTTKIGKALNFEHNIKLKDNEVVNLKPYPMAAPKIKEMKTILSELLEQNVIRPSISAYSSPSFLVKKPNSDKSRLVINYSKLNHKIERVNHPLGNIEDAYSFLRDAKYFSVIDLANSFLQIPHSEQSKLNSILNSILTI